MASITLPEKFYERMKGLLKDDFENFLDGYSEEYYGGLRINTLKVSKEDFMKISPYELEDIPWIHKGFYYDLKDQPAKHPYYFAGLYYIQEPSAMTPATILPVTPGDRVLDLCAAPGGKSTELAAKLEGKGILVSNDISNSRAKALLKNLELFGTRNALITSETPAKLAENFEGYFDKILVDAPCSGEGMFRKSPAIMKNWEQYGVEYYNKLQKEILDSAVKMLKPGGMMVYSTCTFSPEEDEGTLKYILTKYPEFSVIKPELTYEGFSYGVPEWADAPAETANAIRLWPHKLKGEGHFVALLRKSSDVETGTGYSLYNIPASMNKISDEARDFLKSLKTDIDFSRIEVRDDRLYMLPEGMINPKGLRILRSGLLLGEMKKNRFEPSEALAMALRKEEYDNVYDLEASDSDVIKYLKCETIDCKKNLKDGYVLVCVDGFPLGWAKLSKGVLKNKYLSGWRLM